MTEQQSGYQNGRVSTRDLLAAVEGSEERLTHRLDRFEESVNRKFRDHDSRLAVIETERAIDEARNRSIVSVVAGVKGFVLVGIAVISLFVGILTASVTLSEAPLVDLTVPRAAPAQTDHP